MPRIRNAAIVATVLAVGASLAFRAGAFYQHATGVERPTKSAMRAALAAQEKEARSREERGEIDSALINEWIGCNENALVSADTAERFLKKHGRNACNLYAAWYLTKDPAYLIELKAQENDPIAMAILAPNELSFASRARELDPGNAWAILIEANALFERNKDHAEATEAFLRAAKADGYRNYNDLIEKASRDALLMEGHTFLYAWRISRQFGGPHSPQESDPFAAGMLGHLSDRLSAEPRSAEEKSIDQALQHILSLPGTYTDGELVQELFRLKQATTSTERDLMVVQAGLQMADADFELALEFADDAQLQAVQQHYESEGMEAARRYLIDSVGREKVERERKERLQKQQGEAIQELPFEGP